MNIKVEYGTQVRSVGIAATETLVVQPNTKLHEFLIQLSREKGDDFNRIMSSDGKPKAGLLIFVNDEAFPFDADVVLCDGDQVSLMTMISGG